MISFEISHALWETNDSFGLLVLRLGPGADCIGHYLDRMDGIRRRHAVAEAALAHEGFRTASDCVSKVLEVDGRPLKERSGAKPLNRGGEVRVEGAVWRNRVRRECSETYAHICESFDAALRGCLSIEAGRMLRKRGQSAIAIWNTKQRMRTETVDRKY
jgi:hypothetical protein